MSSVIIDAIIALLQSAPASSREIATHCGCDQSTITRQLNRIKEQLISTGRARSTQYYLRRGNTSEHTIYRVSPLGQAEQFATMVAVMPRGYLVKRLCDHDEQYYDDLPWYLQDLRPQGFLGRHLAKTLAQQGIVSSDDIDSWSEQDVLQALLHTTSESVGNFLLGDLSYQQWLSQTISPVSTADFTQLAVKAIAGEIVGSSAGGEQPKFCAYVHGKHRLVKFTEPAVNANSQRWADLLQAEHLALVTLQQHGIPAANSMLYMQQQRTFLSCDRFDRIGELGRKGLVSLRMLDMEFIGKPVEWPLLAKQLLQKRLISADDASRIAVIWCFGRLIGNTDMHHGNLSFYYDTTSEAKNEFALAPVYDMLPMAFAPLRSGAMASDHTLCITPVAEGRHWRQAYQLALHYWATLSAVNELSAEFKAIAQTMQLELQTKKSLIERMA